MLVIQAQINGHDLLETTTKVEYHLKSVSGRTVMTFDDLEVASENAGWRKLSLVRVTTIQEKINV